MTDESMNLRGLLEKTADADLLREMIGSTAQRLVELEVETLTGATDGAWREREWETRAPAPSNCAFPGCVRAATSPASWSHAGWPRRRSLR
jgi:hypothetical protein